MNKSRCHYGCWYGNRCQGIEREEMLWLLEDRINYPISELVNKSDDDIQDVVNKITYDNESLSFGHIKDNPNLGYNN